MSLKFRWYRACLIREGLSEENVKVFSQLKAGRVGELALKKAVKSNGKSYLLDSYFKWDGDVFQLDGVVVSSGTVYILEAKNYQRRHEYRLGQWWSDGQTVDYNPFGQIGRSVGKVQRLLKHSDVRGILVDVNPAETLSVDSDSPYLVMSVQSLQNWLARLSDLAFDLLRDDQLLGQLMSAMVDELCLGYFYHLRADYPLKLGCYCKNCGNFELVVSRRKFTCRCGFIETRYAMAQRMVDEFALLFNKGNLDTREINRFTDGVFNRELLAKVMLCYERIGKTRYVNPYSKYLATNPKTRDRS